MLHLIVTIVDEKKQRQQRMAFAAKHGRLESAASKIIQELEDAGKVKGADLENK